MSRLCCFEVFSGARQAVNAGRQAANVGSSQSLACCRRLEPSLGDKKQKKRLSSYSMNTSMLLLIRQPKKLSDTMLATILACLVRAASKSLHKLDMLQMSPHFSHWRAAADLSASTSTFCLPAHRRPLASLSPVRPTPRLKARAADSNQCSRNCDSSSPASLADDTGYVS